MRALARSPLRGASQRLPSTPSPSLPSSQWEFACEASWPLFFISLFFFLSAQISRQIADYFIRWWTNDFYKKYAPDCVGRLCRGHFYVQWCAL